MEPRTNTSAAGNVGKKLLMAAILSAGLALTGAIQASAHPVNPPPLFIRPAPPVVMYQQPAVVLVKTPPRHYYRPMPPPRHHFRPWYPPPRHHSYYRAW